MYWLIQSLLVVMIVTSFYGENNHTQKHDKQEAGHQINPENLVSTNDRYIIEEREMAFSK